MSWGCHVDLDRRHLAWVVQRMDNAIHRINHYPVNSMVCFVNTYPAFEQLGPGFYSLGLNVKSVDVFFSAGQCSISFSPSPPIPLWLDGGKYPVFPLFFQYDGAWQLPLTGLSWIPYPALGLHYPFGHHSPSSLFVDEFKCCLGENLN